MARRRILTHTSTIMELTPMPSCASEPLRAVTLTLFLEAIAEHCGADLLRLKGIVNILESPERPAVIHGVQHVFHPPNWLPGWPSDDRHSRMIFITRGIPRGWIEALLGRARCRSCRGVAGHVDIKWGGDRQPVAFMGSLVRSLSASVASHGIMATIGSCLLYFDVGRPDHLGPLLGLLCDELAVFGG